MDADSYYAALTGPVGDTARQLRGALLATDDLDEGFKHGHPIYTARSVPICLVKAAKNHVLFAFWEGRSLIAVQPSLAPTGGANMAATRLTCSEDVGGLRIGDLVAAAVALARPGENGK